MRETRQLLLDTTDFQFVGKLEHLVCFLSYSFLPKMNALLQQGNSIKEKRGSSIQTTSFPYLFMFFAGVCFIFVAGTWWGIKKRKNNMRTQNKQDYRNDLPLETEEESIIISSQDIEAENRNKSDNCAGSDSSHVEKHLQDQEKIVLLKNVLPTEVFACLVDEHGNLYEQQADEMLELLGEVHAQKMEETQIKSFLKEHVPDDIYTLLVDKQGHVNYEHLELFLQHLEKGEFNK
jgi:hypothetical protein